MEKVKIRSYVSENIKFKVYEIKGDRKYRYKWDKYYRKCDILLFFVDLTASEEIWEESKFELQQLLKRNSRTLKNMLILGTKNDKKEAVECKDLILKLGLLNIPDIEIACFSISAIKNINTNLILPWLIEQYKIKNSKEKLKLF
ncbi:adp-ribosylation factor-like protein 8a-like protein [Vairimorpha apis BRL 01]|uniref:Adp-ribosylation factor-like protein 8a-like protein n=1 Tax=Vairimorpha apis BRL 01 TaxID=1037528 RepID=T0MCS9_9MICR|nr:adp-ribosylation factor-like protein 8a-like protein [Vairimorpha apis BRL 01]